MTQFSLDDQIRRATDVQNKYADWLMHLPHVVGVGVGYATQGGEQTPDVALVVMVDEKVPVAQLADDQQIPPSLDGVRVDVQPIGSIMAFGTGDAEEDG